MSECLPRAADPTRTPAAGTARVALLTALALLPLACGGSVEFRAALDEGKLLFRKGNFRSAADRLEAAVDLDPDEAEPRVYLARTQIRLGRLKEAEQNLRYIHKEIGIDAIENPRTAASVFVDLGALELRKAMDKKAIGSYFKAQAFFERALALERNDYAARLGKGLAFFGLDKLYTPDGGESAYHRFKACTVQKPKNPEPLYFLGLCNERDRLLSTLEALKLYERVLALVGDPAKMKPGDTAVRRVFNVPVKALDRNYALLALERIVPLRARIAPKELGLDGAEARAQARARHDLYSLLGGRKPLAKDVIDWMAGGAAAAPPPRSHPGEEEGTGSTTPPRPTGVRPKLALLSPQAREVRTGLASFPITVRTTDDAGGLTLKVALNGASFRPEFRDLMIEPVQVEGRPGERRSMTFDVDLVEGENRIVLQVMDREGLTSVEVTLKAAFRPPSIYSVVVGCNGPEGGSRLEFAETDGRDFLRLLAETFGLPAENRVLLVGTDATPQALSHAVRQAATTAWESDIVVVYFAGFGATVEGRRGHERYLVLSRFAPDHPDLGGYPLSSFGQDLSGTRARRIALVLDTGFGPRPEKGSRTYPQGEGPPGSWAGHVLSLFQIPAALSDRISVLLAADGTGTAQEFNPENPAWRKGGIFTTFLLEALGRETGGEERPATAHPSILQEYLQPRLTYFAARAGMIQSPLVVGPKKKPWLGR
ncbi:MAG: tetratricopeptide repeat protein [Planctomycetota bacterium]|jgi:tetratricopeptide (TPR) repeat protein